MNNKYFSVNLPNGKNVILDDDGNKITPISEVEAAIKDTGVVTNEYTYKRWVMAQMFRARNAYLSVSRGESYLRVLRRKGWLYELDVTIDMLERLDKMKETNPEDYELESKFWNVEVAQSILENYIENIECYYDRLSPRNYHGITYKRVRGLRYDYKGKTNAAYVDVFNFLKDRRKVLEKDAREFITRIGRRSNEPAAMAKLLREFKRNYMIKGVRDKFSYYNRKGFYTLLKTNAVFENAYKGYGSYFTLQNMICHHSCFIFQADQPNTVDASMKYLNEYLNTLNNETYYKLFGLLNNVIDENHFSFDGLN